MTDIYICKHFSIKELVPEQVYRERGEKAWELMDRYELMTIDQLREDFGRIHINTWAWGGERQWSGLRTPLSPYGTMYSQHRFGRATDKLFLDSTVEEARDAVLNNRERYPYVKSVELGTSWLHTDSRNTAGLKSFYP